MAELAKRAKALGEANKAALGRQELGAGGAHRRGPVRSGLAGPDDGADLPARADPHRAPHPHAAGAPRPGSGHAAARHRAGHRWCVRGEGAPDARGRRRARRRGRPGAIGQVDRGPQRAPADRGPGTRGDARGRGRVARRRHAARHARAHEHGPGRVPGVPVQRRHVPAHDPHHDPGAVPPSRARVHDHAHRVEQGHLRRVPRTLGGGDLGTRAAARHRRARAGHRSRRDPPPQHDRTPTSCPRKMLTGPTLDVRMSARTTLERALEIADLEHWPAAAGRGARRGPHPRPRVRHVHRGGAGTARLPGGGHAGGAAG